MGCDGRRSLGSWLASSLLHLIAFGWLIYFELNVQATAVPVQAGRASVALMASAPAMSRYVPETTTEVPPQEPVYESEFVEVLEPTKVVVEKTQPLSEPPPEPPPELLLEESEVAVQLPPHPERQDQQPEITPRRPTPIQRALTDVLAQVNLKADGLESIDSQASLESMANDGAEVDTLPTQLPSNPAPPYPADALRAGLEGRVVLRVVVGPGGAAEEVTVEQSSGARSLDDSALTTVRRWRFLPARRGGSAVRSAVKVPVRFTIRNGFQG
jgi:protein TonB